MAAVVGAGGWTFVDVVLFACFLVATPWTVLGFWNAADRAVAAARPRPTASPRSRPLPARRHSADPIRLRTAVLMTLRNEDPARAILRLRTVKASIEATGEGERFAYFVLSDTNRAPPSPPPRRRRVAAWRSAVRDPARIVYRRRPENTGFKAGNVRDFCDRCGRDFDLMLPLDADSLMSGDADRAPRAHDAGASARSASCRAWSSARRPRAPSRASSSSACATACAPTPWAQAWWVGDCGPFWGHNALVRIAPFRDQCDLPILPGKPPLGGHVLSHDQVEATLDAPGRLRGARAAGGGRQLGGEPADHASSSSAAICAGARATCST